MNQISNSIKEVNRQIKQNDSTYNNYFILPPKYNNINDELFNKDRLNFFNKTIVRISSNSLDYDWRKPFLSKTDNSTGSGFFINDDGVILTCSHVVENAYKIFITLPNINNDNYEAEIICIYPERDIALLKILNYKNKEYFKCGNSDIINQSTKIIAVGYMLGSKQLKITTGSVNGITNNNIQMDAIINPGNSGGPLLNYNFEVIGINSYKNIGANLDGLYFAIPIKQFIINKDYLLNSNNKVIKAPKLGCNFSLVSEDYLKYHNLDLKKYNNIGLIITNIIEKSPAYNYGLKVHDLIIEFNNYKIDNKGLTTIDKITDKVNIEYLIYNLCIGDKIPIKLLSIDNNNNYIEKNIIVDLTYNNFFKIENKYPPIENVNYIVLCGLVLMDLSRVHIKITNNYNLYKYRNPLNRNSNKVIITNIIDGSNVNNLDIVENDTIIKSINHEPVNSIDDIFSILKNIKLNNIKYINIITEDNDIITMNIDDMLKEDKILSEYNGYKSYVNKIWIDI